MKLEDVRVVVTGSSRGIGRAIATEFAKNGADVVVNCHESPDEAKSVVKTIESLGRRGILCVADVRSPIDCARLMAETKEALGGLDVLVNNAGITRDALILGVRDEDWNDVISTNLTGVMNCTRAAVPLMREHRKGRIVNISSVVGLTGNIGQTSYSASKAGVIGLTKTMARELAKDGILVNAIAPGFTNTEMVRRIPEEIRNRILQQVPLKRLGEPEEIAATAVFLSSKDSTYITGQVIEVNGGYRI